MALPDSMTGRAQQGAKVRRDVLGAAHADSGKRGGSASVAVAADDFRRIDKVIGEVAAEKTS